MNHLKIIVAALAFGVAVSAPLQAQQKKGGMSPDQYVERVEQAVGSLTDAQKTKIKSIAAKTMNDVRALPKEERKEKGQALQKKQRDEVRAVLTPEQQKKYDAMAPGGGGRKKNK